MSRAATASVPFSDDGSVALQRSVDTAGATAAIPAPPDLTASGSSPSSSFSSYFSLPASISFILSHHARRVALQLPDSLLSCSSALCHLLRCSTGAQCFVLADTSYGSCCVDEVAAQHVAADVLIHYGFACLAETKRIPVLFVLGKMEIDAQQLVNAIQEYTFGQETTSENSIGSEKVTSGTAVLLYDLEYEWAMDEVQRLLEARPTEQRIDRRTIVAHVHKERHNATDTSAAAAAVAAAAAASAPPAASATESKATDASSSSSCGSSSNNSINGDGGSSSSSSSSACQCCTAASPISSTAPNAVAGTHHHVSGFHFTLPPSCPLSSCHILMVTSNPASNAHLTNLMLNYNSLPFHLYSPATHQLQPAPSSASRLLSRRFFLIQAAKNAAVIGIVVGTLGVASYATAVAQLRELIRAAGKKSYVFVVGKVNEAKLGNYAEVDVFVLVACEINCMLDSAGWYKQVITPYECYMALKGKQWNGTYQTNLKAVTREQEQNNNNSKAIASKAKSAAAAVVAEDSKSDEAEEADTADADDDADSNYDPDEVEHGVRYDSIAGKLRSALPSVYKGGSTGSDSASTSSALIARSDGSLVPVINELGQMQLVEAVTAGTILAARTWRGLGTEHQPEDTIKPSPIEMGLEGIAREYKQIQPDK